MNSASCFSITSDSTVLSFSRINKQGCVCVCLFVELFVSDLSFSAKLFHVHYTYNAQMRTHTHSLFLSYTGARARKHTHTHRDISHSPKAKSSRSAHKRKHSDRTLIFPMFCYKSLTPLAFHITARLCCCPRASSLH